MTPIQQSVRQQFISQRHLRGIDVIYSRGDDSVSLTVVPARTATVVESSETNVRIRSFTPDFLILPKDLVLNDDPIYPQAGDEITDGDASYQVPLEFNGEPAWRWDDQQTKQIFRVHTQLIAGT